jgi:hypothetical protein
VMGDGKEAVAHVQTTHEEESAKANLIMRRFQNTSGN